MNHQGVCRGLRVAACLLLTLAAAACNEDSTNGSNPIKPVVVTTPVTLSLSITGQTINNVTLQLTAVANLSNGTTRNVTNESTWRSSNVAVATVSATGVVSAVGTGTAEISATFESVTGTFPVNARL